MRLEKSKIPLLHAPLSPILVEFIKSDLSSAKIVLEDGDNIKPRSLQLRLSRHIKGYRLNINVIMRGQIVYLEKIKEEV